MVALAFGGLVWLNRLPKETPETSAAHRTKTVSPSLTPSGTLSPAASPSAAPSPAIPADWQTFRSVEHHFSLSYPPGIEPETHPDGVVNFSQWGPTQKANTEFYDGLSLSFTSGLYSQESLGLFVQLEADKLLDEPVVEKVGPVEPVNLGPYSGWQFEITVMGTRTNLYLPAGPGRFLKITNATQDPTGQGFQQTVGQILKTLSLTQ